MRILRRAGSQSALMPRPSIGLAVLRSTDSSSRSTKGAERNTASASPVKSMTSPATLSGTSSWTRPVDVCADARSTTAGSGS